MWLALIILGLLFMIAAMALLFNPPEALVKRVFSGPSKAAAAEKPKNSQNSNLST